LLTEIKLTRHHSVQTAVANVVDIHSVVSEMIHANGCTLQPLLLSVYDTVSGLRCAASNGEVSSG
jgi:hypothetical protein